MGSRFFRPHRELGFAGLAVAALVLVCGSTASAQKKLKSETGTDRADREWAHQAGTTLLVLEPPQISGAGRWVLESPRHRGSILCMAVSPDGTRAATGGTDAVVRIWNLADGTLEKALAGHSFHLHTMAWSPDGRRLATHAWGDRTVRIWNVETGSIEKQFEKHYHLRSLCWSSDGKRLAGATDGSGRVYVSDELAEPRLLTEIGQAVRVLAWSPDGTQLAVSSVGSPVTVLDASSGSAAYALVQDAGDATSAMAFSPDGTLLATGGGKDVAIWTAADGAEQRRIKADCADLAWSPDSARLATVASTGLFVWNVADGKPAWKQSVPGGHVHWSADTGRISVASTTRLAVRDAHDGADVRVIDAGGGTAPVFQAGRPVITGLGTPVLSLWDSATLKRVRQLEGHGGTATAAAWSRDGKQFATADAAGAVRIWDVKAWSPAHTLEAGKRPVSVLEWSPDGKLLAAAGSDKIVRVWTAGGEGQGTFEGHTRNVQTLAWAPGGRQLVSGGLDGDMIVWDVGKGAQDRKITSPVPVTALAWSQVQGKPALAVGGRDGSIRVWNPTNGEMLGVIVDGHRQSWFHTEALGWMPGNRPLILSVRHYLSQIWDASNARSVQRQMSPGGGDAIFPTAGGGLVVSRCGDRTVRFWDPAGGSLRGTLLAEGESLVAVTTTGDVKFDPAVPPGLIAIVETPSGQQTMPLDDLAKRHGWKNRGTMMRLPAKN
jgi:WD40 repeat protein